MIAPAMGLATGTKLGPYEIQSPLGAGGMGEVYRARDTRLGRDVAVKVLSAKLSSDPASRQRLEREAKAVSKLSHPPICTLHDIEHQDGVDFLVMELVEGETLDERLAKGPLPPEQAIRIAAQIADALAKAHKLEIVHRDLKPSNVMLTKTGAKLMDFGLAKEFALAPVPEAMTAMTAQQSKLTAIYYPWLSSCRSEEHFLSLPRSTVRSRNLVSLALVASLLVCATRSSAQQATSSSPLPVHLTAEQDHQRILDLLHITSLRRGADGDPKSPNAANYDESKITLYSNLPDPLAMKNGKKLKTAIMWWKQRRPEIVEDFDREVLGRVPPNTPKVNWEVTSTTNEKNGAVPVITKNLIGHVDNSAYPLITLDIQLTLTTPANATGPVPVIMELSWSAETLAAIRKRFTEAQLAALADKGPTWQQQVLAQGWGYASVIPTSIQADNGAGLTDGIIGLVNRGQPRKLDDWGALRAWAWGASRALDYFETDKSVDAKQVGLAGHSRYGKATLVAMAYDPRFVIAYVSSSGEAGAKLYRRNFGEQIGNVAGTGEYHWMAGNFVKYAGTLTENDLPVDSHELIALCAPRPVFIGGGALQGDGWADAKGMFLAAAEAGPVYKLLGKRDLGAPKFPPIETPLIDGDIAFRQHSGGHTPAPNWPTFLTFASRYLKSPPVVAEAPQKLAPSSN